MFILRQIKKVITKREDVTKQVSVNSYFCWVGWRKGVGFGCGRLFEFEWKGEGVGAYSRLSAY